MEEYIKKIFVKLAKIPSDADPKGLTSEAKRRFELLNKVITSELENLGVEYEIDENLTIYASLESDDPKAKTIMFNSHIDTALEYPTPKGLDEIQVLEHEVIENKDIELSNGVKVLYSELKGKAGENVLTGNGEAQIGADDKCGVAIMLALAKYVRENPGFKIPNIKLVFTNNEEVGLGTQGLRYKKINADAGYCVDGDGTSGLFKQNFNAQTIIVKVSSTTVHPGYAYNKMENALVLLNKVCSKVNEQMSEPQDSKGKQGYVGLNNVSGNWSKCQASFIVRSFTFEEMKEFEDKFIQIVEQLNEETRMANIVLLLNQQPVYQNAMIELDKNPLVNELAIKAYDKVGIEAQLESVRGGFDGVDMTFAGLPTTNVFNGSHNMHGLNEWVSVQDMELSYKMCLELIELWSEQ